MKDFFKLFLVITVSIVLAGLILIAVNNFGKKEETPTLGLAEHQSKTLFYQQEQNIASVSITADDDLLVYDDDQTYAITSLSVGDVIRLETSSTSLPAPLQENEKYWVITVTNSVGFEIARTKGGSVIDITEDTEGQEYIKFFQETAQGAEVKGLQNITVSIDAEQQPSVAFKFLGSIQTTEPDWLASQSDTNQYEYLAVYDVESSTEIEGDIGATNSAGINVNYLVNIYADALNWVAVITENFASGSFTSKVTAEE